MHRRKSAAFANEDDDRHEHQRKGQIREMQAGPGNRIPAAAAEMADAA